MARLLAGCAAILCVMYGALCALLYFSQDSLLYHPTGRDASIPTFILDRGDARVVISTGGRSSINAVIYFGGNGEDVSRALPMLQRAYPDSALFAMHYRGYGGSTGSPNESAITGDALDLYDHIRQRHSDIVLVGRSLGSGIAVKIAAQREIDRLVLVTPYDSIATLAAERYPWFPVRQLLRDSYDALRAAPMVKAPVTIVVASNDRIVPQANSRRLADAFPRAQVQWIELDGTDHNSISGVSRYIEAIGSR